MATAREKLIQALCSITMDPFSKETETTLKRLLNTFRIQSKASVQEENATARDLLINNIIQLWKIHTTLEKKDIQKLILPFRMQIKQGLNSSRFQSYKKDLSSDYDNNKLQKKKNAYENAYFKNKKNNDKNDTLIAGGPVAKNHHRGVCPKCRSNGIVLARTYGKDDKYSCIYCGYQSFAGNNDDKLDLCMAAQLLGDIIAHNDD